MRRWLLDTGPIVAYLDAGDPFHPEVRKSLDAFPGRLLTTGAVVTEAMHFVSVDPRGPGALARFLEASDTQVYDLCRPPEIRLATRLMEQYADTPMDFADATLVLLAEAVEITEILTLDRRGFSTYRTRDGQAFISVLPTA